MIRRLVPRRASPAAAVAEHRPTAPIEAPSHFDPETREIWTAVREFTMTTPERIHALCHAVRYLARHDIGGAMVECGVWRGGSMMAAALTLMRAGDQSRDLYLYDTYEGMPPPGDNDRRWDGREAADMLAEGLRTEGTATWLCAGLEDVQANMAQTGYDPSNVHFVKGMVEDTLATGTPDRIAMLRLDTDWYESTRRELEVLYPRLVVGGVLVLDDYGHWEGARRAVDEFISETGTPLLLNHVDHDCRIAVKVR